VDVRTLIGSEGQGQSAEAFRHESFSSGELRRSENVASPNTRLADSPVNAAIFEIGWGGARPDPLTPDKSDYRTSAGYCHKRSSGEYATIADGCTQRDAFFDYSLIPFQPLKSPLNPLIPPFPENPLGYRPPHATIPRVASNHPRHSSGPSAVWSLRCSLCFHPGDWPNGLQISYAKDSNGHL
jgi:hypothetical protein